jgi:hypothetical protein
MAIKVQHKCATVTLGARFVCQDIGRPGSRIVIPFDFSSADPHCSAFQVYCNRRALPFSAYIRIIGDDASYFELRERTELVYAGKSTSVGVAR